MSPDSFKQQPHTQNFRTSNCKIHSTIDEAKTRYETHHRLSPLEQAQQINNK
jgi:hypothetical protein